MRFPATLAGLLVWVLYCQRAHAWSLFGKSQEAGDYNVTSLDEYGPVVYKTMMALRYHVLAKSNATASNVTDNKTVILPYVSVPTHSTRSLLFRAIERKLLHMICAHFLLSLQWIVVVFLIGTWK